LKEEEGQPYTAPLLLFSGFVKRRKNFAGGALLLLPEMYLF
jgi:hypothetical protein